MLENLANFLLLRYDASSEDGFSKLYAFLNTLFKHNAKIEQEIEFVIDHYTLYTLSVFFFILLLTDLNCQAII